MRPQPPNWPKILKPGSRIFLSSGAGCPAALMEQVVECAHPDADIELLQSLMIGPTPWVETRFQNRFKVNAFYLDTHLSELVNAGIDDYTPAHLSEVPSFLREGLIHVDVCLIMVSPPDDYGYCSLGTQVELTPSACKGAPLIIAQINPQVPRSHGLSFIHISEIDYAIEAERPLPELLPPETTEVDLRIGAYVAQLINDGDTLQLGVGRLGTSVIRHLENHRQLGIHSETIGDGIQSLFESGVIDNSRKTLLPGKLIAANALGSEKFYRFLHNNPHIDLRPSEFVNAPLTIARNDRMVAIRAALQTDLTGQIVFDSIAGKFCFGFGSQSDFLRGASLSRGGRPIVALRSTSPDASGECLSNILAVLPAGAGVGVNRADIHYLVTEYGVATLRGRSIQERVAEIIQIAHPDFREELLKQAYQHHLVPKFFQLPPPYEPATNGIQSQKIRLSDGTDYILRPLAPADDRRLQEFFYSHTEETIIRRYGFTVTRMSRERAFELVGIDQNVDLALGIFELQGPRQVIHAVGRYYRDLDQKSAEMAFVVSEKKRRLGMARKLLEQMIETARKRSLEQLWAQVDRDNTGMLKLFKKFGGTETPSDTHTVTVRLPVSAE